MRRFPERPALAETLGRPQPIVPIRGDKEVFRYPRDHVRVTRAIMYATIFLAGFLALGWLSDVLLGRTRFVDPATGLWELLLIGGFSVGALVVRWMVQAMEGELEISEEGVTYWMNGKPYRTVH